MATTKRLTVTELDFDDVKSNLKTFMRNQNEFKDYDFEGSGLSALLDVLAYNTHYLAFNANMLANEMFLDSSQLRSSVVSHAKTLGYTTRSARAAQAVINVYLNTTDTSATMTAGTVFTASIGDTSYQFVTIQDTISTNIGSVIPFNNLSVYEGSFVSTRYTTDTQNVEQRFLINDARADTTTLTVKVQNSSTDSITATYTLATDIAALTSTSNVYFLQEVEDGKFEIYFGDDILGNAVVDGNIIILNYVVTNKGVANSASTFTNSAAIDGISSVNVSTVSASAGGSEPETIQSIKYNAPLDYASQGRCVTAEDYKTYVKQLFPNTQAVSVWGGENGSYNSSTGVSDIAEYGKVFISVKSTTGLNLNEVQKAQLVTDLASYTVASITPVVVDPETLNLILNVNFKYDSSATTRANESLVSLVNSTVTNYNTNYLKVFNSVFRHSQFTGLVDATDSAILSNITTVSLSSSYTPNTLGSYSFTVNLGNPLYNPHSGHNAASGGVIASTGFYVSGNINEMFFDDDGVGNLRIYYLVSGVRTYYLELAGTVDYLTGLISTYPVYITEVSNVDGSASTAIRLTGTPNSTDIVGKRNQILEIDILNTTVTGNQDTIAVSSSGGGSATYNTSSSYIAPSSY
tara:strand:- start:2615 stop:4516 length:1902 start_codon:yes stop_codon:yes gene_type:complete